MCTGAEPALLYASLAATAAGTYAQIDAKKQQRKATDRAASEDLMRKQKTALEAQQIFNTELQNSNPGDAEADADKAAAEQLQAAQELTQRSPEDTGFVQPTDTAGMANASPVVKEVAARQLGDELAKTEGQMKARSVLQGYQQRFMKRGQQFGRGVEQMQLLGNFNKGWDQVAQTQAQLAKNAGSNSAMLGDLLVGAGSMGTAYSTAKGASLFGNAATSGGSTLAGAGGPYGYTSTIPSSIGNTPATYGARTPRSGLYF